MYVLMIKCWKASVSSKLVILIFFFLNPEFNKRFYSILQPLKYNKRKISWAFISITKIYLKIKSIYIQYESFKMLYLCKTTLCYRIYTEQCRDHKEIPTLVQSINYLNVARSIYSPEKKVQPQNKRNTYCSIFSTKIQKFYKKSVRSVL